MKKIDTILNTDGHGLWSNVARPVHVTAINVHKANCELRVYFNTDTWDVEEVGLIYTDILWQRELRAHLVALGFSCEAVAGVGYSEQGMQGDDYVSLDVTPLFVDEWKSKGF